MPRSGSTWLGSILDAHPEIEYRYQPLFSYAFKGRLNEKSSRSEIVEFFGEIANSEDEFLLQIKEKRKGLVPEFKKSNAKLVAYKEVRYHNILEHLLQTDLELQVVGIIRHPLAVLNSWWKAPKEFRKDQNWDFSEEWMYAPSKNQGRKEEYNGFAKWLEVQKLFTYLKKTYPNRFFCLRYEELNERPIECISEIMKFLDLAMHETQRQFIFKSKQVRFPDPYSVFKGNSSENDWSNQLPPEIISLVKKRLEVEGLLSDFPI